MKELAIMIMRFMTGLCFLIIVMAVVVGMCVLLVESGIAETVENSNAVPVLVSLLVVAVVIGSYHIGKEIWK